MSILTAAPASFSAMADKRVAHNSGRRLPAPLNAPISDNISLRIGGFVAALLPTAVLAWVFFGH